MKTKRIKKVKNKKIIIKEGKKARKVQKRI